MNLEEMTRRAFLGTGVTMSAGLGVLASTSGAAEKVAQTPVALGPGEKLRVAILGCGNRSKAHIDAVNYYADRMEVAALCDILPEMLEEKKRLVLSGVPRLYTDHEQMLREGDDIHAVAIVLPNTLHRMGAVASLEAGKHVLCEKPMTLNLEDARAIIEASDRTGCIVQVGTQSRHAPPYRALAQMIRDGLVGNTLYGWAQTFRNDWRKLYADPVEDAGKNWRMKQSEGGAVVYEMGIHTIDVFNWFIGSDPVEISALGGMNNTLLEKRDSWDHAAVTVRYANGALLTYGGNLYCCGGPGPDVLFGDKASLQICSREAAKTTLYKGDYRNPFGGVTERSTTETLELPKSETDCSTLQYAYFLEAVQGKQPPFPSARDHVPAVLIARASLLSQMEGRHIKAEEVT